jgi:transcription initiation factor TFIIIB Brf1 subunit/transcription initiation factor TFIIB
MAVTRLALRPGAVRRWTGNRGYLTQAEIADVADVSKVTVRERYREIEAASA